MTKNCYNKFKLFLIPILFFLLSQNFLFAAEENSTIIAYYPAPKGNYQQVNTDHLAVGNYNDVCWNCTTPTNANTDLLVNNRVGIGVKNPAVALDINGQIRITGGDPKNNRIFISDDNGLGRWSDDDIKMYLIPSDPKGDKTLQLGRHSICILTDVYAPNEAQNCWCQITATAGTWAMRRVSFSWLYGGCACEALCMY